MKVKSGSARIVNNKKPRLTVKSKLLKPKTFKNRAKSIDQNIANLGKKLKLAVNDESTEIKARPKIKKTNDKSLKDLHSPPMLKKNKHRPNAEEMSNGPGVDSLKHSHENNLNKGSNSKPSAKHPGKSLNRILQTKQEEIDPINAKHKLSLKFDKVSDAVTALKKYVEDKKGKKAELLDLAQPIFLQVECIKIPESVTKKHLFLNIKIPHPLFNQFSDILLVTADLKGSKIYPEKAVEHYTELLKKANIDFITKVMPIRSVRQEYSQFEMKRKLVDQHDVILADKKICLSLPHCLGKSIFSSRKVPVIVQLDDPKRIQWQILGALKKTQMCVTANGHSSTVQVGHNKMTKDEIVYNIIAVCEGLAEKYPGGWKNIRSLMIKTDSSPAFPVYFSMVSPNEVTVPVRHSKKKEPPVEGELSTMIGVNVVVKSDGTVILKKTPNELPIDDTHDDEIIEEAKNYVQSSKTVRYDSEESDSDEEAEAVTAAVEQQYLKQYEDFKKEREDGDEEEEEEEVEDSSEDEEPVLPFTGKKRKPKITKSQGKLSPGKKQKTSEQPKLKGKIEKKTFGGGKAVAQTKGGAQNRGTRGGKKKKMNKDQRKALIKKKKAGKA